MMASKQRVLITGGAGFIGSQVADALLKNGHEVAIVDNLSSGRRENLSGDVDVRELDIRGDEVKAVFSDFRPQVMFHLAAQMDVRRSVADPAFDAEVNILGSLRLLECCREFGTSRVIFSSTGGAIYGEQDSFPAPESHPNRPCSPYGVAKLSVEHYLSYYASIYGMSTVALRYANVYGPRQNPSGEAGVVAIFFDRLLNGAAPTIYGDGEQTRDYVFVGDVVAANVAALEHDLSGAYNVGTGVETSVNQLFSAMRASLATEIEVGYAEGKTGEQRRSCLDASKLTAATGWRPSVSLADGLALTRDYFRAELEARRSAPSQADCAKA
jgi:UDP-glucose 4-epimerase